MSIVVSGSVHSITSNSPGAIFAKSFRVLSAGSGHFKPRMLTAASSALVALALDSAIGSNSCPYPRHTGHLRGIASSSGMLGDSDIQRIARLTPLADVLASFDLSIRPVAPREEMLSKATGLALAADVIAQSGHPRCALALRDGFAIRSEETLDASSYAPATLSTAPVRVDTGEPLPEGADAIAPVDAVQIRGALAEALSIVAPDEGVLLPDTDAAAGLKLRLGGAPLRRVDVPLLAALGVERVTVRQPRVRVACESAGSVAGGAATLIASAIDAESGTAITKGTTLEAALNDDTMDAVVAIGGTGRGRHDQSGRTLA